MRYGLRRPCRNCPFRHDVPPYLNPARAREIVASLERGEFPCHETTVEHDDEETGMSDRVETPESQHCAGALIMLEHANKPSQMMRIAERLRMYDASKLDMTQPVFTTTRAFIEAQKESTQCRARKRTSTKSSSPRSRRSSTRSSGRSSRATRS